MFELSLTLLGTISATVFCSAILRTFSGFGFALAAVPIFSLYLSPVNSVVLSALLVLAISLLRVKTFCNKTPLRPLLPLLLMMLLGTLFGTYLLTALSAENFRVWAGLCVVLACIALTIQRSATLTENPLVGAVAGLISGIMNGLLAMGGPAMVIHTLLYEPNPKMARIKLMSLLFIATLLALLSYSMAGLMSMQTITYFLVGLPSLYLGDKFGNTLFERYGQRFYRKVAISILFAIGLSTLISSIV